MDEMGFQAAGFTFQVSMNMPVSQSENNFVTVARQVSP